MIKPVNKAFLKHDLYKLDNIKIASKGARFIYWWTDRKDAEIGWYADAGNWGNNWAKENLTEPTTIENTKF